MTRRSEVLVQAPVEDAEWDRHVLGPLFGHYEKLLNSPPGAGGRELEHDLLELVEEIALKQAGPLGPLPQVLLSNACADAMGAEKQDRKRVSTRPFRRRGAAFDRLATSAPLFAAAIARYYGEEQLALPGITNAPGLSWSPLGSLYLANLTAQFDDSVSVLLHFAGAVGRLEELRRRQLNSLLFHPLQNANQHGRHATYEWSFSGVAVRLVQGLNPETPSFAEYRAALGARFEGSVRFLEVVVHDNGIGIAAHFYDAKRAPEDPDLFALHPFHEWETLRHAFERHQTSKPASFRRATQPGSMPGVGLVGLLSALKQLRAYLELRTGRLRVFQWYREEDQIPNKDLLQPAGLPAPGPRLSGTTFRMLVPLDRGESVA
jgi:hypothetical protein